jgi:hypothetical protein
MKVMSDPYDIKNGTEIIELTIIDCKFPYNCWYYARIGYKFDFWNSIFIDDAGHYSIWVAMDDDVSNINEYVRLDDTDYFKYIRRKKLIKIDELHIQE